MKRAFLIILSISSLISIAACNSAALEETTVPVAETMPETASIETTNDDAITISQVQFDINLDEGTMDVIANYKREDINDTVFMLNRDFVVTKILCDGEPVEIAPETVFIENGEYEIKKYRLPEFEKVIHIEYTGTLSGKTGTSPYVRERITPEFTFLRSETFCHPLFATAESYNENYLDVLNGSIDLQVKVNVPKTYIAQFIQSNVDKIESTDGVSFTVTADSYNYVAIAIAKYKYVEIESGFFYFLENTDVDKAMEIVEPAMVQAYQFLVSHFGEPNYHEKLRVVEIPENFGSFARESMTFVQGSAFKSINNLHELIQELTHNGWNAKTDEYLVKRSRFFDEAFSNYFEYRVMADLLGDYITENWVLQSSNTYGYELVPISEYGMHEYGGLSYTLGALCLYRLSELVGIEVFDQATKEFLDKYRDTPVDFDLFTSHYIEACDNPDVEDFFQRWIYTDAYKDEI